MNNSIVLFISTQRENKYSCKQEKQRSDDPKKFSPEVYSRREKSKTLLVQDGFVAIKVFI
jgi:hypothetical protein